MTNLTDSDEIDRLIDGLLANPEGARKVKARLRRRIKGRAPAPAPTKRPDLEDPEEYWNNVPV